MSHIVSTGALNLSPDPPIEEIAIIGMAGRFPKARTLEQFWINLRDGIEAVSFLSDQELLEAGVDPALLADPRYVKADLMLEDIDLFDADFFGYSPRQVEILDPQQRLFLEVAWESLENAGYSSSNYQGRISLYGGSSVSTYFLAHLMGNRELIQTMGVAQLRHSNRPDNLATRVAHKLDLKGAAITVQTGCSTSLVALHLACQSLLDGESDLALAGGVSIQATQRSGYLAQEGGIASPDGHCRAFDAQAQGTLFGNGLGIVVLKRLGEALEDGDHIHAVIKGSAINNDGAAKIGYTAPSVEGQAQVIAEALAVARTDPEQISYVEAHGTATPLGDPIEIAALTQAFRRGTQSKGFCSIGSVKTNIGHLDAAAGIAGLLKTVLALKHQQIPPSLRFQTPNPRIDFANSPFLVAQQLQDWPTQDYPRKAGVSSFGIGGTNAHVILEETPPLGSNDPSRPWQLVLLSAKTNSALETATANLIHHCQAYADLNLADLAYTLLVGRQKFDYRRMVVCQTQTNLIQALEARDPNRVLTHKGASSVPSVVFMFPGQGSQYVNMGQDLYESEEIFREEVDRCAEILTPKLGLDLRQILYPIAGIDPEALQQTQITQPVVFVIDYAMAQLWLSWGISPQALIGHSLGEYVAACLAEVFTLEDTLKLVVERGRLLQSLPTGSMLSIPLPEAEILPLLKNSLSLAAVNSSRQCVVSGSTAEIAILKDHLTQQDVPCRELYTSHAFHSPMMDPILESFAQMVAQIPRQAPQIPFISNLSGTWITPEQAVDPHYWTQHLRQTVRFADGIDQLTQDSETVLLEVGPGCNLSTLARRHLPQTQTIISSMKHPQEPGSDVAFLLRALGHLWLQGVPIDGSKLYPNQRRHRIPLPTYPFERKRYWIDPSTRQIPLQSPQIPAAASQESPILSHPLDQAPTQPQNETERIIAEIWQQVLGLTQIGIHDRFIELGGDSVMGIQVIALAHQKGLKITPGQLFQHQTIAELADVVTSISDRQAQQDQVIGSVPLTPAHHHFFSLDLSNPEHWATLLTLDFPDPPNPELLKQAFRSCLDHHDALRLSFVRSAAGWQPFNGGVTEGDTVPFIHQDLSNQLGPDRDNTLSQIINSLRSSLNLEQGSLIQAALCTCGSDRPSTLCVLVHELVMDSRSWQILLDDLVLAYQLLSGERSVEFLPKTTSFKQWAERLLILAHSEAVNQERSFWLDLAQHSLAPLPVERKATDPKVSTQIISMTLPEDETQSLLEKVPEIYHTHTEEILLTALAQSLSSWTGSTTHLIQLELPERASLEQIDLSATVGQLALSYPIRLTLDHPQEPKDSIQSVKEQVRAVPHHGAHYGLCRYLSPDPDLRSQLEQITPEIHFVYQGEWQSPPLIQIRTIDRICDPNGEYAYLLELHTRILKGQLQMLWYYNHRRLKRETIERLSEDFLKFLRSLIQHCQSPEAGGYTPADFSAAQINPSDLNHLLSQIQSSSSS